MDYKSEVYKANGKILLTAEYLVLLGAQALCLPLLKKGQSLRIDSSESDLITWNSYEKDQLWFATTLDKNYEIIETTNELISKKLIKIFQSIKEQRPEINFNFKTFCTFLNFDRHYGLGTSSTLISLLSQWSKTDPYQLLNNTFGGSGYDLACAVNEQPLIYTQNKNTQLLDWDPKFKNDLYFIYLNQKQSSQNEVKLFLNKNADYHDEIQRINRITYDILKTSTLEGFEDLLNEHEQIISRVLQRPTIKEELFSDYSGSIKSLGAWGGDFILVSAKEASLDYFRTKGFNQIFRWDEFIYE